MKIPIFSKGTVDQLEKALTVGVYKDTDRVIWHYVTEGDNAGSLILVYTDKTLHYITDTNLAANVAQLAERITNSEQNIETLDIALQAVTEALDNYATWSETVNSQITELTNKLNSLEETITSQGEAITEHDSRLSAVETVNNEHSELITNLQQTTETQATLITNLQQTSETQANEITVLSDKVNTPELDGKTVPEYVTEQIDEKISVNFI